MVGDECYDHRPVPTTGRLQPLCPPHRAQHWSLPAGSPGSGRSLTVRLDDVDAVLRRSDVSPVGLAAAVTALAGPVVPLGSLKEADARVWQEVYAPLDALADEIPALAPWTVRMRGDGLLRRLVGTPAAAHSLLGEVVTVLRALPVDPPVSLPTFAARVLGAAHTLDDDTPRATVTLAGIRALTDFPEGADAEWRREAWASGGLLRDELSSTVLTLNLRGAPVLDWAVDVGEPSVLTLRQLRRP
ncbi:TIGR02679 domain-containing protein [Streptomyces goshikiensis]